MTGVPAAGLPKITSVVSRSCSSVFDHRVVSRRTDSPMLYGATAAWADRTAWNCFEQHPQRRRSAPRDATSTGTPPGVTVAFDPHQRTANLLAVWPGHRAARLRIANVMRAE